MACHNRVMSTITDLNQVKLLAQRAAILTKADQKVYKAVCNGRIIYKYSPTWKGETICTVRYNPEDSGVHVFSSVGNKKSSTAKPRGKAAKRDKS